MSDSSSPVVMGTYYSGQAGAGVATAGGYVYVAEHNGLKILNVADPAHPSLVGSVATVGQAYDVAVSGNIVVMAGSEGLEVINASNLTAPTRVGGYDFTSYGFGYGVAIDGSHAYMAGGSEGLMAFDISTPSSPKLDGTIVDFGTEIHTDVHSVVLSGQYAYMGGADAGVAIVDISNPAAMSLVGGTTITGYAGRVALNANYLLVAAESGGLQVIDTTTPSTPAVVAVYGTPNALSQGVTVVDTTAYIADGGNGLRIVDVSDPASPRLLGTIKVSGGAFYDVAVQGDYAYIADHSYGLRVVNVSDRANPVLVSSYREGGFGFGVAVAGDYVYLADREYFDVINISNPASPTLTGQIYALGSEFAYRVTVVGNYAYVAEQANGLHIIDISDPARPAVVGKLTMDGLSYSVAVQGDYAYIADAFGGLKAIDVSDRARPVQVGQYQGSSGARSVSLVDHYAMVADNGGSVFVVDITDPTQLSLAARLTVSGHPQALTMANGYAYLVSWENGLVVLEANEVNAPTALALSNDHVGEGLAAGATVGTLSAADLDAGDTLTYSLVSGQGSGGNGSFRIDGDQLETLAVLNRSAQNSYTVRVRASDSYGLFTEQVFTIGVTGVNRGPTVTSFSQTINQDTTLTIDPGDGANPFHDVDGDRMMAMKLVTLPTHGTLYLNGGEVTANQTISGTDLDLPLTYEPAAGYVGSDRVTWTASDGQAWASTSAYINITVKAVKHSPTDISLSSTSVAEGQPVGTVVGRLSSVDPDAGDTFTYSLVSGDGAANNGAFMIVGRQLRTNRVFSFPLKSSYTIRVRVTDQTGRSFEKAMGISVTEVAKAPTNLALTPAKVAENQPGGTVVGTLSAADSNITDTFTYTLAKTATYLDNALFTIEGNQLQTLAPFNYEAGSSYTICVRVMDSGGKSLVKTLTVAVRNVNEVPANVRLLPKTVAENALAGTRVGNLAAVDPDVGNTFTYAMVDGGADNASFTLATSGRLTTNQAFNFETKPTCSILVRATDQGGLFCEKTITINVKDVNEAPADVVLTNYTVLEHQPASTLVGKLIGTDPDAGNTLTYMLVGGTGARDNAMFSILGTRLRTAARFDYATQSVYKIRVRVTDQDDLWYEKAIRISVTQ